MAEALIDTMGGGRFMGFSVGSHFGGTVNPFATSALIGASNFLELAVAADISIFGLRSGAALATVFGVLIEVPVLLLVVRVVNRTRPWYEDAGAQDGSLPSADVPPCVAE